MREENWKRRRIMSEKKGREAYDEGAEHGGGFLAA